MKSILVSVFILNLVGCILQNEDAVNVASMDRRAALSYVQYQLKQPQLNGAEIVKGFQRLYRLDQDHFALAFEMMYFKLSEKYFYSITTIENIFSELAQTTDRKLVFNYALNFAENKSRHIFYRISNDMFFNGQWQDYYDLFRSQKQRIGNLKGRYHFLYLYCFSEYYLGKAQTCMSLTKNYDAKSRPYKEVFWADYYFDKGENHQAEALLKKIFGSQILCDDITVSNRSFPPLVITKYFISKGNLSAAQKCVENHLKMDGMSDEVRIAQRLLLTQAAMGPNSDLAKSQLEAAEKLLQKLPKSRFLEFQIEYTKLKMSLVNGDKNSFNQHLTAVNAAADQFDGDYFKKRISELTDIQASGNWVQATGRSVLERSLLRQALKKK